MMELRPAVPADADVLTALAHRAKASWGYPSSWLEQWRPDLTLTPEYLAAHQGLVAVSQGAPIGGCILEDRGTSWTLEHFWVEPAWQGRGVGRRLLSQILTIAHSQHSGPCDVLADPHAEAFYLRHGAVRVGAVPAPMPGALDRALPQLRFTEVASEAASIDGIHR